MKILVTIVLTCLVVLTASYFVTAHIVDAEGIAQSQKIIAASLTDSYLQYLAIDAQKAMANGSNHTEIYIPSGENGIPLVKTLNGQ